MTLTVAQGDVFYLRHDDDAARVCVEEVQQWIRVYAERFGFGEARLRQMWVAVWEALQNAIVHGSAPGEEIEIRLAPAEEPGQILVEVTQPRAWDPAAHLGAARKREVDAGEFLLGGTIVLLWLADAVHVEDKGRRLVLRFAPRVKDKRRVNLPAKVSAVRGVAAGEAAKA